MTINLFSLYDSKAMTYGRPFCSANHYTAQREVLASMRDPQSILSQSPADFTLVYLGAYDDQTGAIDTPDAPGDVIALSDLLVSANQAGG